MRVHAGERRAPALEHGRALAAALEHLCRPSGDEPGEERGRQALAVDDDRLPARELASRSSRVSPELPRRITRRAIS